MGNWCFLVQFKTQWEINVNIEIHIKVQSTLCRSSNLDSTVNVTLKYLVEVVQNIFTSWTFVFVSMHPGILFCLPSWLPVNPWHFTDLFPEGVTVKNATRDGPITVVAVQFTPRGYHFHFGKMFGDIFIMIRL